MTADADTLDVPAPSRQTTSTHEATQPTEPTFPDAPTLSTARVRFNCPNCHKELTVPADEPLGECPQCGASLAGANQSEPGAPLPAGVAHRTRAEETGREKALEWMQAHFEDKYEVLEFVKSGGMGAVYRARQKRPSRIVALKVLLGGHFASPVQLKRFEREAQAVALLQHPAIVPVYEYGEADGQPYFTMEFVEGTDLRTYALENRLSREEICRQMVRVCDAIQYAHEHGVIHRDLKPGNIMVDELKRPRILDFGLSRAPISEDDEEQRLTVTGEYLGTPRYMSPEQAMGKPKGVDERTDVFALGVMLFEMIVGALPYPVEHARGLKMVEILTTWEPLRPGALRADIPRDLEIILLKAVAREKDERYQSARALSEDLENWLAGRPITARPATLEYLLNRWLWRNRKVLVPAAIAALVLLAFSGYYVVRLRQEVLARRASEQRALTAEGGALAYMRSFATGRQAVDTAVQEGRWQMAYEVAQLAPTAWPGQEGVEELARKVRRAAEQFTRRQMEAYAASVARQDYDKARQAAADLSALAVGMPYDDLKGRLAGMPAGFDESCWQALKTALDQTLTPEKAKARTDAYLSALPESTHAAEARALPAELSAKPVQYFLKQHEKAFERDMDARQWQDAEQVLDSGAAVLRGDQDASWAERLDAMRARLAAVIRPETAAEISLAARLEQGGIVYGLSFSADGKLLATVTGARAVALWDPAAGRSVGTFDQTATLRAVAFSPDGRRLAAGAEDGSVEVWSVSGGQIERTLAGHAGMIRSLAFTPDGSRLLTADRDAVALWDLATGERVQVPNVAGMAPAAVSPDGDLVAAAIEGGTAARSEAQGAAVGLWELAGGLPVQTVRVGTLPVVMAFSPGGTLLATGHTEAAGRHVRIWRIEDGEMTADLAVRVGSERVLDKLNWALAFSPDGALLATGDVDNSLKLWEVATGKQLAARTFASVPRCVAFSPDSRSLAVGLTEGTVVVMGVGAGGAVPISH